MVTLLWLRRDLRLSDHPALVAACQNGPVIPVYICDEAVDTLGAAPKWRLGLGLDHLAAELAKLGSRLILRRGRALDVLQSLIAETGAGAVYWTRLYDPFSIARDSEIKTTFKQAGIDARSFGGHLLFEPQSVETKTGGYYRVYTPFWKAVRDVPVESPLPRPRVPAPDTWPNSDQLEEWQLGAAMRRGAAVVRPFVQLGEGAAQDRLAEFTDTIIAGYRDQRDRPDLDGTSCLSENLALGEISPHTCWHAGRRALEAGKQGAETFLKELVWREFAHHLMFHSPHMLTDNWKPDWDKFPWSEDAASPEATRWQQARTGIPFVDAGLREMYVTGRMHNRARMIVASYLTKHLMTHWRIGQRWFEECLIDWDPASNAMGWQWAAGSGPDAAPYFRVFNPVTQLAKFDPNGAYARRWIAEGHTQPHADALAYFDAVPRHWQLQPKTPYPAPVVAVDEGRKRALGAYESRGF